MWLVLNKGFLSVVKNAEGDYLVRSRCKDHIQNYFPDKNIYENAGTDYKYRIILNQDELDRFFDSLKTEIDYSNFKNSVKNEKLKSFCGDLWFLGLKHFDNFVGYWY